jgi:hypothetical protein
VDFVNVALLPQEHQLVQKRGRSPAQTVKWQWFHISPAPSAFSHTFVIPLLPQACSSKKVCKLVAKVACIVVALEQIKCFKVERSRRIGWRR